MRETAGIAKTDKAVKNIVIEIGVPPQSWGTTAQIPRSLVLGDRRTAADLLESQSRGFSLGCPGRHKDCMLLVLEPPSPITPRFRWLEECALGKATRARTRQGLRSGGKRLGVRPKADGIWTARGHSWCGCGQGRWQWRVRSSNCRAQVRSRRAHCRKIDKSTPLRNRLTAPPRDAQVLLRAQAG